MPVCPVGTILQKTLVLEVAPIGDGGLTQLGVGGVPIWVYPLEAVVMLLKVGKLCLMNRNPNRKGGEK